MTTDEKIGARIHQIMWNRKMKQGVLAERLGVGQAAVSKKLHGERKWTTDELVVVAEVLEVPVGDLFPIAEGPAGSTVPKGRTSLSHAA